MYLTACFVLSFTPVICIGFENFDHLRGHGMIALYIQIDSMQDLFPNPSTFGFVWTGQCEALTKMSTFCYSPMIL